MSIFIAQDESGDLGFDFTKKGTSRCFCIAFVTCSGKRKLEKIVKRVFSDFSRQRIKHRSGILHAYDETPRTNHLIIKRLKETDAQAFVIKVDKSKIVRRDVDEFYCEIGPMLHEYDY
jgi:hypothetical protein